MIFRKLITAAALLIAFSSCSNTPAAAQCDPVATKAPADEVATLKDYIRTAKINATADPRGFFYTIDKAGSGDRKPSACSTVKVNYAGRLTNGTQFDAANDVQFPLSNLIVGWQEGIPLIAPGGSITLYLPPSLAYGSQSQNGIPANSILIFKIDLKEVSN